MERKAVRRGQPDKRNPRTKLSHSAVRGSWGFPLCSVHPTLGTAGAASPQTILEAPYCSFPPFLVTKPFSEGRGGGREGAGSRLGSPGLELCGGKRDSERGPCHIKHTAAT